MDFVLFDTVNRNQLFPFTHTRPVADIRCGILTIKEKWEKRLDGQATILTLPYLMEVFNPEQRTASLYINGHVLPQEKWIPLLQSLNENEVIFDGEQILAFKTQKQISYNEIETITQDFNKISCPFPVNCIQHSWDIFTKNGTQIQADFEIITKDRVSQTMPKWVTAIHPENIFIEEGAEIMPCIINASDAKVYIGKDALIMEGALLRGNIAIHEHAVIKMGAKIYSDTTLGPNSKVGGEVQNVVFFGNSNKGHDGYLGNAVIGEWCNLGADTNCSNLKNDYGMVDIYSEAEGKSISTGLQFVGLMMGDHSKCGINTMFNTATVVGVSCNIFGGDFIPKYLPSFSWGGSRLLITYQLEKALITANKMMERRGKKLSSAEERMLQYVFEHSPIHQMRTRNIDKN